MWFTDLVEATNKAREWLGKGVNFVCIESVRGCADGGIVFALSDFSRVKWFPDGSIKRFQEGEWRK